MTSTNTNSELFPFQNQRIYLYNHDDYRKLLNQIKPHIKYVQIVNPFYDNEENALILFAKEQMELIETKKTNRWLGTISAGRKATKYIFKFNQTFFDYLKTFEAFYLNHDDEHKNGNNHALKAVKSSFPDTDIAFLDKNYEPIFYSTVHEGLGYLNPVYTTNPLPIKPSTSAPGKLKNPD